MIFLTKLYLLNLEQLVIVLVTKLILKQLIVIASFTCSILIEINYC